MAIKKKVLISVAVWGSKYIANFINFSLSSQLSENNLPKLKKKVEIHYQIITTKSGKNEIEKNFLASKLKKFSKVNFVIIDKILSSEFLKKSGKYFFLSALQTFSLKSASNYDYIIFNYADFIWADGSLFNLTKHFSTTTDAVLTYCPIVQEETALNNLKPFTNNEGIISINSRDAVNWFFNNIHREEKLRFWNDEHFTVTPTHITWPVDDEGAIITAFHKTILSLKVNTDNILYFNGILTTALDGYFSGVIGQNMNVTHIKNSDDFFATSFDDNTRSDSRIGGKSRANWSGYGKTDSIHNLLKHTVSLPQRKFATFPYLLIKQDIDKKKWEKEVDFTRKTLNDFFKKSEFNEVEYFNHYSPSGYLEVPKLDHLNNTSSLKYNKSIKKIKFFSKILQIQIKLINKFFVRSSFNLNGSFTSWNSKHLDYKSGAWSKLPANSWSGHFDSSGGSFSKSEIVPNNQSKYSLFIKGSKDKKPCRVAQPIPSAALIRAFRLGFLKFDLFIRTNSPKVNISIEVFGNENLNNEKILVNKGRTFIECSSQEASLNITALNQWKRITFVTSNLLSLKSNPLFCFIIEGLDETSHFYMAQVDIHSQESSRIVHKKRSVIKDLILKNIYSILFKLPPIDNFFNQDLFLDKKLSDKKIIDLIYFKKIKLLFHFFQYKENLKSDGFKNYSYEVSRIYNYIGCFPNQFLNTLKPQKYLNDILKISTLSLKIATRLNPNSYLYQFSLAENYFNRGLIGKSYPMYLKLYNIYLTHKKSNQSLNDPLYLDGDQFDCKYGLVNFIDGIIKAKILSNDKRIYKVKLSKKYRYNNYFVSLFEKHLSLVEKIPKKVNDIKLPTSIYSHFYILKILKFTKYINYHQLNSHINYLWNIAKKDNIIEIDKSDKNDYLAFLKYNKIDHNQNLICIDLSNKDETRTDGNRASDFNNNSINDFFPAINYLVQKRYTVILLGDNNITELDYDINILNDNKKVIILNDKHTDKLLMQIISNSKFFISSEFGQHHIANALGIKICLINTPLYVGIPCYPDALVLPKVMFSISKKQILSFDYILKNYLFFAQKEHVLFLKGISLLYNTREAILETVAEFIEPKNIAKTKTSQKFIKQFEKINSQHELYIKGYFSNYFMNKFYDILFKK